MSYREQCAFTGAPRLGVLMGLSLMVGVLADMQDDTEFAKRRFQQFEVLSRFLVSSGLQAHNEPREPGQVSQFSWQMFGYSGLHHLRRLAAYSALMQPLYTPARELPKGKDPIVEKYYQAVGDGSKSGLPFQHLMLHSDAEGYYVPQDFKKVLFPDPRLKIAGGTVGSSQRLLAECTYLAKAIELPLDISEEAKEVWDAADQPGAGPARWQKFGIEAFGCIRLIRACQFSIKTGVALVYC